MGDGNREVVHLRTGGDAGDCGCAGGGGWWGRAGGPGRRPERWRGCNANGVIFTGVTRCGKKGRWV